ncbi:tRNA pseudouridine(65) synthase TruC [Sulfurimonas sp. C5]|uniref:tRNA pseudouridine(65) synthase TruC n=1 Tax=Sulfurimonas sp. C5 TaxID=3036947 RepID=UPI002454395C|nr:tRNA pseudouridine(65) synthase TruC [Sulfurimonas sp. C5]MDH4943458.1 tRNA pseudouridine(65) synthase TruC [Sulfurimonas sp. C5]
MFANYTLEIIYQDKYLVAINKPSGLLVHKSMIDRHEIYYAMKMLRDQIGQWVYPIHRLDKPTSGVLLFALDKDTARLLNEQFRLREPKKTYLAVVRGWLENGIIDYPLKEKLDKIADKDAKEDKEAQEAVTEYKSLGQIELHGAVGKYDTVRYSLVELKPQTGRKHQLRRHMKHISHHMLGDTKYGRGEHNKFIRKEYNVHRLLLHCTSLEFVHPYSEETIVLKAKLDDTFKELLNKFNWSIDE